MRIKYAQMEVSATESMDYAVKVLRYNEFKMWIYLVRQRKKKNVTLEQPAFCQWAALSNKTFDSAVKMLLFYHFLEQNEDNSFTFYELPKEEERIDVRCLRKR